jgi:polar amino acid transport system permease protein
VNRTRAALLPPAPRHVETIMFSGTARSTTLTAVCTVGVLAVLYVFITADFAWAEIPRYLFAPQIVYGARITVLLTVASMALGIAIGIVFALMRVSDLVLLRSVSSFYVWLFRGIPLLVQIIFWFNLALFMPRIGFGDFSVSTNVVMGSFTAALIALSLNEGAYMAEIIRGGILAVDSGQVEAARALGIGRGKTFRRIVLPQALRVVIPATGNQLIGMLKATSLVSVIGVHDLLTQAQFIYTKNYLIMELLIVAAIWYLALTAVCSLAQHLLERWVMHRAPDDARSDPSASRYVRAASVDQPA